MAVRPFPVLDGPCGQPLLEGVGVEIAGALVQGQRHFDAGQTLEALWWWQFSYLSEWGVRAAASLRALLTILRHLRLDVDDEAAAEAEFDALHP